VIMRLRAAAAARSVAQGDLHGMAATHPGIALATDAPTGASAGRSSPVGVPVAVAAVVAIAAAAAWLGYGAARKVKGSCSWGRAEGGRPPLFFPDARHVSVM